MPICPFVRKIEHGGTWWAQRPDGAWLRWSRLQGDWEPAQPPPGAEFAPPQVAEDPPPPFTFTFTKEVLPLDPEQVLPVEAETLPAGPPSGASLFFETVMTYLRLATPAGLVAILFGLVLPLLFMLMWTSSEQSFMPIANVLTIGVFGAVYSAFLTAAVMAMRLFGTTRGMRDLLTWGVPLVLALVGFPIAWMVSGNDWIGTTSGRLGMHAALAGAGLAFELWTRGTQWVANKVSRAVERKLGAAFGLKLGSRSFGFRTGRPPRGLDVPAEIAGKAISEAFLARHERSRSAAEPWAGGPAKR